MKKLYRIEVIFEGHAYAENEKEAQELANEIVRESCVYDAEVNVQEVNYSKNCMRNDELVWHNEGYVDISIEDIINKNKKDDN